MHLWPQVKSQAFFVLITLKWMEQIWSGRSVHPKKQNESKNTPDAIKVLQMTRSSFITAALTAHGYQNVYIPGPTSSPGMQISWVGFL